MIQVRVGVREGSVTKGLAHLLHGSSHVHGTTFLRPIRTSIPHRFAAGIVGSTHAMMVQLSMGGQIAGDAVGDTHFEILIFSDFSKRQCYAQKINLGLVADIYIGRTRQNMCLCHNHGVRIFDSCP